MSIPLALQNFLPNWVRTIIGLMPFSPASRRYLYMKFLEADRRAATHVLGVPTGFFEHIRGWVARTHAHFRAPTSPSLGARGGELRTKGLEVLGPVVPTNVLTPVIDRFQERLASESAVRVVKEGTTLYEGGISFGAEDLPIITPVMVPEIVDALRAATGGGFRVVSYFAWRIHHLPSSNEQETYAERWHSDGLRTDAYKVFVFLNDVTREDGGTVIADRDTTRAACRAGYRTRNNYGGAAPILAALDRAGGMCGPAGTVYIVNTSFCLHRAGVPAPGRHRDVLQIQAIAAPTIDLAPLPAESLSWIDRQHFV